MIERSASIGNYSFGTFTAERARTAEIRAREDSAEDFKSRVGLSSKPAGASKGVNVVLDIVGGSYLDRNLDVLASEGRLSIIATQGGSSDTLNILKPMQKRSAIYGWVLRSRAPAEKGTVAERLLRDIWPLLPARNPIRPVVRSFLTISQETKPHDWSTTECEDDAEPHFSAVHLFVTLCHPIERILLDHRMHAAQRTEFQRVLRIPRGP